MYHLYNTMSTQQTIVQPSFAGSKFALSIGLIIVSIVYVVWQNLGGGQSVISQSSGTPTTPGQSYQAANSTLQQTLSQIGAPTTPTPAPTPTPQPMMNKPMMRSGLYADGSYTGSPADAYYGTVQVKAIISGGKIADVQFLQYPSDRSTSRYINGQAMPMLTQEAIQAQSANVDGVSGATATSGAFIQSLASALALAKN